MAFICCPEDEAKKRMLKLAGIKEVLKMVEDKMAIPVTPVVYNVCTPVCCYPMCCPPCSPCEEQPEECPAEPYDIMVCYKDKTVNATMRGTNGKTVAGNGNGTQQAKRTKRSKSRELRGGILYTGCDCEKRNGLQDDCPRTGCHGSPECLTTPEPICGPSEFSNGKHLTKKLNRYAALYGSGGGGGGGGGGVTGGAAGDEEDGVDANGNLPVAYRCYPGTITCANPCNAC